MLAPFIYSPPDGPISIIHRDADILVLDKPSGLLTVPGKHEDHADCLERRARAEFPEARIVHRLDMDTSGVILLAMNPIAHRHLGLQFERRHVAKSYIAEVWGIIKENEGDIDLPLRCDWPNRPKQIVDFEDGRNAETHWRVLDRKTHTTRVALHPKTGRSHQLRVHMLETGHPILGDNLYAPTEALRAANRLHLHAESLELHHPSGGERVTFNSPCPF